jgi:soluble lytic murein transglycosylase
MMTQRLQTGKTQNSSQGSGITSWLLMMILMMPLSLTAQNSPREQFVAAWTAASNGNHAVFSHLPQSLADYELFPYLVYEDLRHRRGQIAASTIAKFLEQHSDWAFADGLRLAWLKTLGKQRRWKELLNYSDDTSNTILRCYRARALIETGKTEGLLQEAQSLWTVGKSQADECDPVFDWLKNSNGISPALAWERIRLAMNSGNPRFTLYLARFVPAKDRPWLSRWQELDRKRYRNLEQTRDWPDQELTRMITEVSLQRLAERDAELAWKAYGRIKDHFNWAPDARSGIVREIALQAAVSLSAITPEVMAALPRTERDDQLLQWWARMALATGDWPALRGVIEQLPPESRADGRWRYWQAMAAEHLGHTDEAMALRDELSRESSYYGFLAADRLKRPYSICPLVPMVSPQAISTFPAHWN